MIAQLIWLTACYALIFAIGLALIDAGAIFPGYAVCIVIPVMRIALRFSGKGGYYFMGSSRIGGNAFDRSGKVTRAANPLMYRLVFIFELAVIVAFALHSVFR